MRCIGIFQLCYRKLLLLPFHKNGGLEKFHNVSRSSSISISIIYYNSKSWKLNSILISKCNVLFSMTRWSLLTEFGFVRIAFR